MAKSHVNREEKHKGIMEVIKRNGKHERVSFDKIIARIENLCYGLNNKWVDPIIVAKDTIKNMYNGISTEEIDFLSADICASQILIHPDFNKLAARLCISNLHKTTDDNILSVTEKLYRNCDKNGSHSPLISEELYQLIQDKHEVIEKQIDYDRDFNFNFFGIKTLERSYLMRIKNHKTHPLLKDIKETKLRLKYGMIVERPQHLIMRVSLGIHGSDLDRAFETYEYISNLYFTHATPTMYNSGTPRAQMSSCFLLGMEDSIDGIFKTISDAARISKWSGGIGIHISDIRGYGSLIRGTNGTSDGTVPLARVLSMVAKYVNQGGKRNGSIALYVEPWHTDIWQFCELRKNTGEEELRARDLFLALWVPDIFMERVDSNGVWSLMCPDECPGLTTAYGEEFTRLYEKYESEGKFKKQIRARALWEHILVSQIETGMPYMAYKDNVNRKTNQINIGTIQSSNLCCEIMQYSDHEEYAVCNLASICLPRFLEEKDGHLEYNYEKLYKVVRMVTYNLNRVIDLNYYPTPETKKSNMRHRPIGLGVQGLADVYNKLGFPFGSSEARLVNKKIFETIYFASLTESNEIAKTDGAYSTFEGSPFSKGILQFDMWGLKDSDLVMNYDWNSLKESIKEHGTRNSLVTALMPTASTSQIMGNNECIEPYHTNMYIRTTIAGEYIVINENLVRDLVDRGLWTQEVRNELLFDNGSVQKIDCIPDDLKKIYLTAFEIKQNAIVKQAVERGPFIDQSQSMNIFMAEPNFMQLTKCHFYGWKNGIKTGLYYLRSCPAVDPIKFGLDSSEVKRIKSKRGIIDNEETGPIQPVVSVEPSDPRRINEIENDLTDEIRKGRFQRPTNLDDCEMCGA